jgi:PAS domain S-box-containing protein
MAKKTIIQHAVFGGAYAEVAIPFFARIVGVLFIAKGTSATDGKTFIHIAFDELLTSYTKIAQLYCTLALTGSDDTIVIYTQNDAQRKDLSELLKEQRSAFPASRIIEERMYDFTGQVRVADVPREILLYLARPDEASPRLMTKEGAMAELEDTKQAILNLLEDARESEEKITKQANDLAKALENANMYAKTAEEERATYHQLVSSIGEGVIVLDEHGLIKIVNDVTVTMTGERKEDLYNKKPVDALNLRDREGKELPQEFRDAIVNIDKTVTLPILTSVRKDGKVIYASSIAAPIINETTGERKGVIITFRNISDDLALDEARTTFISTASHQLRTPLTTMRWFVEMLKNGDVGPLTDAQRQYILQIDEGIARMTSLVNFLLRTARVETSRVRLAPRPLSIRAIINDCITSLKARLDNKKQTVTITGDNLPDIALDPDYATEVFTNLLMNAQLYGKSEDTIIVDLKKNGDYAEIHITDHGIGITREERKRVFEKFFRSGKAVVASPDGSGLGLAFVKTLVTDWGGKIWFESEEGKGATFSVSIPLAGMRERKGEVTLVE